MSDGWARVVIDAAILAVTLFMGYQYLDNRFDRVESLAKDRWTGADMMSWVSGAERAHEEASNPKDVKLPNPYVVRRLRADPNAEEGG